MKLMSSCVLGCQGLSIALVVAAGCSDGSDQVRAIEQALCQNDPNDPCCPGSPIILDLEGNGFELTDLKGGVSFNLNPGGSTERISWTARGSDDAWLVLDRNGNGTIDSGAELFGNFTAQPASDHPNGYLALAVLDSNHDGVIDAQDKVFGDLRLWQDRSHDGVSDADELSTLSAHGIIGLGVESLGQRVTDAHGNLFRYSANVAVSAGSHVGSRSYDVFLITEPLDRQARSQGALLSNGAVSMGTVEPEPFCSGDGGDGGGAMACSPISAPPATCLGGAALCVVCTSAHGTCQKVCVGFLPLNWNNDPSRDQCGKCPDNTCIPGTAADSASFNCTSFVS